MHDQAAEDHGRSPRTPVWRWADGRAAEASDRTAREEPLEIRVRGRSVCVTMRTPGDDEELAAGFLLTEGIVDAAGDIVRIEHCARNDEDNVLNVVLDPHVHVNFEHLTRHVFASSSCGLCGKATIDEVHRHFPPVTSDVVVDPAVLLDLPRRLRAAQPAFDDTGGLHAAGVFDAGGDAGPVREDVGRHNAVDKVLGRALLDGELPFDRHVLLVSGRASFEILQKALAGRVPVVAAVGAPSSLAVDFAAASGQTLVGFLRDGRMNVYAGPRRVKGLP
ncbi:MAG: formate dehydrogenase accessory sulfurtransferase FdhD [Planctomycetota bacterium]